MIRHPFPAARAACFVFRETAGYTVAMRAARTVAPLLALLVAAFAALSYLLFLRPAALKARVREILEQYLAAEITLGSASLGPFGGLVLEGSTCGSSRAGRSSSGRSGSA